MEEKGQTAATGKRGIPASIHTLILRREREREKKGRDCMREERKEASSYRERGKLEGNGIPMEIRSMAQTREGERERQQGFPVKHALLFHDITHEGRVKQRRRHHMYRA